MRKRFTSFCDPQWAAESARYEDQLFEPLMNGMPKIEAPMLIEGLLPKGYLVMLAAGPKEGKTCLATAMAYAVATGTKFAGLPVNQAPVLWMCQEESVYERYQILYASPLADPAVPLYTCFEYLPIDRDETLLILSNWVEKTGAKLIVIDPLHGSTSGRSLLDGWSARKSLQKLKRFCNQYNVTALVLHHAKDLHQTSRMPRVAESDQLAATASLNMVLRHQVLPGRQGEPDSRLVTLYCTGRGRFGNQTVAMRSRGPLDYAVTKSPGSSAPVVLNSDEQRVVEFLQGRPKTSAQIGTLMGEISDEALRSLLTRLRTKGAIRLVKSEKRPRRWRVSGC